MVLQHYDITERKKWVGSLKESERKFRTLFETFVNIYLPASIWRAESEAQNAMVKGSPTSKKRVLVMDDEEMLRNLVEKMLERLGYAAETVKNGIEAVETYKTRKDSKEPFDAVILDLTIKGGMGGKQTVQELLKIDPHVRAIVCTGYAHDPIMTEFQEYGFKGAMAKPYEMKALEGTLKKLLL